MLTVHFSKMKIYIFFKNFTQITKLYLYYFTEIREDGVFVQVQDNSLYFILFFIMLILQQQHNLKERVREK